MTTELHPQPVRPEDEALIDAARDIIRRLYIENRHHIAAAVR